MKIDIITLFPDFFNPFFELGLIGRAQKKKLLNLSTTYLREFTNNNYGSIDDTPYGGGEGMVICAEPMEKAFCAAQSKFETKPKSIYLSPQGKLLSHAMAESLSKTSGLILICGRYAGVDQRFLNKYVDEEISIGNYVVNGGEVASMVLIEALARFLPDFLGDEESVEKDSLSDGLLEAPIFTRPSLFHDVAVPEIFLSGDHKEIEKSRAYIGLLKTFQKRPELFKAQMELRSELKETWDRAKSYYMALSAQDRRALGFPEKFLSE